MRCTSLTWRSASRSGSKPRSINNRDGVVALHGLLALAQRVRQPLAQRPAAHAAAAAVQQRQQRGCVLAAQRARQFEVAVRAGRQRQQIAGALHRQPGHVAQRLALGVLGVAQQCGGRRMGGVQVLRAEAGQRRHLQLLAQLALAERAVELPAWARGERAAVGRQRGRRVAAIVQDLGRVQPRQPAGQIGFAAFAQAEAPAGQPQPGQADDLSLAVHRQQQRVGALGQQFAVGDGAGRDHAHHLAFHRPLGSGHVADLLGHRHRLAELDQPAQVAFHRVHRHAGHDHRLSGRLPTRGQGDVEQPVRLARVVEEQLVEIAHAIEDERVRELRLDAQVLLHHRRVRGQVGGRGCGQAVFCHRGTGGIARCASAWARRDVRPRRGAAVPAAMRNHQGRPGTSG